MKKNIKKFINSKLMEYIKLFFYGVLHIIDSAIPVILFTLSIIGLKKVVNYNGYYACTLFLLAIIGVCVSLWGTYKLGKQYFSICKKDKNTKNKVEKTDKKTTSKKENNTKPKETTNSEMRKN